MDYTGIIVGIVIVLIIAYIIRRLLINRLNKKFDAAEKLYIDYVKNLKLGKAASKKKFIKEVEKVLEVRGIPEPKTFEGKELLHLIAASSATAMEDVGGNFKDQVLFAAYSVELFMRQEGRLFFDAPTPPYDKLLNKLRGY